jgi:hypothetical protein
VEDGMHDPASHAVFIVRLTRDPVRGLGGIVERVRTGQKVRFRGLGGLAEVVASFLAADQAESPNLDPAPPPGWPTATQEDRS